MRQGASLVAARELENNLPALPPGSNAHWRARSLRAVWHPCTQMKAHGAPDGPLADSTPMVAIASAEGPWLTDVEGRRYLDGISSWWTNLFGHGHPRDEAADWSIGWDQWWRFKHVEGSREDAGSIHRE